MASNNLSAKAAAFTPGATGNPHDSFTEYSEMVENIEQDMDETAVAGLAEAMNNTTVAPPPKVTGLPSHMVKHAAEFWFPECRDCSCCKGFKHGCQCAPANSGVCTCSPSSIDTPAPAHAPAGGRGKPTCKFFLSPGGCRFGESCRFTHV